MGGYREHLGVGMRLWFNSQGDLCVKNISLAFSDGLDEKAKCSSLVVEAHELFPLIARKAVVHYLMLLRMLRICGADPNRYQNTH